MYELGSKYFKTTSFNEKNLSQNHKTEIINSKALLGFLNITVMLTYQRKGVRGQSRSKSLTRMCGSTFMMNVSAWKLKHYARWIGARWIGLKTRNWAHKGLVVALRKLILTVLVHSDCTGKEGLSCLKT
jgi:hypothetical protein